MKECHRCCFNPTRVFRAIIESIVIPCNFVRCSYYYVHPTVCVLCLCVCVCVRASRGAPFVCLDKEGGESRGTVRVLTSWHWAPPSGCDWQIASVQLLISSLPSDLGSASQHCSTEEEEDGEEEEAAGDMPRQEGTQTHSYAHIWTGRVMLRRPCSVWYIVLLFIF